MSKPWEEPNLDGEYPGDICCQRAAGKYCYEHNPKNYKDTNGLANDASAYYTHKKYPDACYFCPHWRCRQCGGGAAASAAGRVT